MTLARVWFVAIALAVGAFIGAICGAIVQGADTDVEAAGYLGVGAYALVWGAVAWWILLADWDAE